MAGIMVIVGDGPKHHGSSDLKDSKVQRKFGEEPAWEDNARRQTVQSKTPQNMERAIWLMHCSPAQKRRMILWMQQVPVKLPRRNLVQALFGFPWRLLSPSSHWRTQISMAGEPVTC